MSVLGFRSFRSLPTRGRDELRGRSLGKGAPGQSTALHLRGRRLAPTSLRCSVLQPAAELASLTAFAALRQWRRVSPRCALARAAASPVLLGAPQARRGLPGRDAKALKPSAHAAWRDAKALVKDETPERQGIAWAALHAPQAPQSEVEQMT